MQQMAQQTVMVWQWPVRCHYWIWDRR